MNKLIHTDPPSEWGRWLARSMGWTLVCLSSCRVIWHCAVEQTLAFAPGLGATSMTYEGRVGHNMTVLATAAVVVGYFIFIQTALPGFPAASRREKDAAPWLVHAACAWLVVVKLLKWAWVAFAVVIVLGCLLSVTDEGRTWN